jgi:hypothetical protein
VPATFFFLLVGLLATGIRSNGAGNCRSPDSWSGNSTSYFTRIVTSGSAGAIQTRQALQLPAVVTTPAVTLVTDDTECVRAVTALSGFYTDGVSHAPVYVFRIGTTRFAAADATHIIHIFDSSYNYLVTIRELD